MSLALRISNPLNPLDRALADWLDGEYASAIKAASSGALAAWTSFEGQPLHPRFHPRVQAQADLLQRSALLSLAPVSPLYRAHIADSKEDLLALFPLNQTVSLPCLLSTSSDPDLATRYGSTGPNYAFLTFTGPLLPGLPRTKNDCQSEYLLPKGARFLVTSYSHLQDQGIFDYRGAYAISLLHQPA